MDNNKTIEALEKLIQIKDETIKELEKQIQLLKKQSANPITQPFHPVLPVNPLQPITMPLNPNPWQQPYIVFSEGTSANITIIGDPLPPGAVQSCVSQWDITNSNGSTNIVDFNTAQRC
jgi:hypothetical protein